MPSSLRAKSDIDRLIVAVTCVSALVLVGVAFGVHGARGVLGVALGIVGTSVSLFGTWMAVLWIGRVLSDNSPKWQGAVVPVAAMVIKLPVILGAMAWALRLGPPAPAWFLAGLALVYFGLIWWAVTRH